ncbi:MAG: TonB family protein, partial [Acidobacteria bacterium]
TAGEPAPPAAQAPAKPRRVQVVPPRVIERAHPIFPPQARRLNKAVTVTVKVLVGTDGRVREAELVSKPVGFGVDEAALRAARQARYEPATADGKPIAQWTTIVMRFEP